MNLLLGNKVQLYPQLLTQASDFAAISFQIRTRLKLHAHLDLSTDKQPQVEGFCWDIWNKEISGNAVIGKICPDSFRTKEALEENKRNLRSHKMWGNANAENTNRL